MKGLRLVLAAAALLAMALWLASCGGSTTLLPGPEAGQNSRAGAPGSITISVHWPESSARIIPAGTDRIRVHLFQDGTEITRPDLPLELVRDPGGGLVTVMIRDLPVGPITVSVFAYSDDDPTRPLASATNVPVELQPGLNTPVTFTLASAVDSVELTPDSAEILPDEPADFTATALDDQGRVILGIEFAFAAEGGTYFSVTPDAGSDNTAVVQGVRPGSGGSLKAYPANDPSRVARAPITVEAVWVVSTFAGTGNYGSQDGDALTEAEFGSPVDVAVDNQGNVYVADEDMCRICVISNGQVTTLVAGQPGLSGGDPQRQLPAEYLAYPEGVDVDDQGNVYVADSGNDRICVISGGEISVLAGTGWWGYADGDALEEAEFAYPTGVSVDDQGNVFVGDTDNNCIRQISGGVVTTIAGVQWQWDSPPRGRRHRATEARPVRSRQYYPEYPYLNGPADEAVFFWPIGLDVDDQGNIYVADSGNNVIRLISDGQVSTLAGSWYLPDWWYYYSPSSRQYFEGRFLDGSAATAMFNYPTDVALGPDGEVYVADQDNNRIRRIFEGWVSTVAGRGAYGWLDGLGNEAEFFWPAGVDVDAYGNIYVADSENCVIRKVAPYRWGQPMPTPQPQ